MRKNPRAALMAAVATTSLFGIQLAHASNFVWDGGDGTNPSWSNALNWASDTPPSSSTDTVVFDNTGTAALANTVDLGLATTTFSKLTYAQTDPAQIYTTTIDRAVNLSLLPIATTNSPTPANASLLVMPATTATASGPSGTIVKFVSSGTGSNGKLVLSGGGSFAVSVSGRSGASVINNESFAVLDLTSLDEFIFRTDQGAGSFTNSNFGIGGGNASGTGDTGAYSGKVILGPKTTLDVNRLSVGGQNINGALLQQPVSLLLLGQDNSVNQSLSGTLYVGSDANAPGKDSSGGVMFRAGLTNPVLNQGDAVNNRNGFQLGSGRNNSTSHSVFGVIDTTSASGGSEGTYNGFFSGLRIAEASNGGAGSGNGMLNIDKGAIDTGTALIATARSTQNTSAGIGVINVGVKGAATDLGGGVVNATSTVTLGQRTVTATAVHTGIITVANNGAFNADRIFMADNTVADNGAGGLVDIINLDGGTLTTGQIQAGSDTAQVGTKNTRLVNLNGGTLKVKAATVKGATFMQGLTAANVYVNGGSIDTNGESVTIAQPLVAASGSGVDSIAISSGGSGYRVAPIVVISPAAGDTTGAGATAMARIDSTGAVTGITVTNPGTGYTAAPTVALLANAGNSVTNMQTPFGGTAASLTANLVTNSSSGGITKVGVGVLTLTGSNTYGGPTNVNQGGLILAATGSIASPNISVVSGASLGVNGALTGTPNLTTSGAVTFAGNTSTTTALATIIGVLNVNSGGSVTLASSVAPGAAPAILLTSSLNFADNSAKLDLTNNKVFTTATNAQTKTNIVNGSILTSTPNLSVGYSNTAGTEEIRATYAGDANLTGVVNTDDFNVLATNFNASGKFWQDGDFNYDGTVNMLDFNALATNFGSSLPVAAPALGALVPEPASITLIGLAGLGLVRRRKR